MKKTIIRRQVADHTRANILKTARKLFAETGFSATTTQAIAKAAKVNETLIFHHFQNKEKLWQKVKEEIVNNVMVMELDLQPNSLRSFLEMIFKQRLEAYKQQPELIRLLQWQRLESKQQDLVAGNMLAPLKWLEPIKYLQSTNKLIKTIPPEIIMVWLLASINAMILDNFPLLQEKVNREIYLRTIIEGFEKALVSK